MSKWVKLIDAKDASIRRGSVLRIRRNIEGEFDWYPDAYTDFLVFDPAAKGAYGLMVNSGHKSGMIYIVFPPESKGGEAIGLQRDWVINNWKKWVYPDGLIGEVWVRDPEFIDSFEFD